MQAIRELETLSKYVFGVQRSWAWRSGRRPDIGAIFLAPSSSALGFGFGLSCGPRPRRLQSAETPKAQNRRPTGDAPGFSPHNQPSAVPCSPSIAAS